MPVPVPSWLVAVGVGKEVTPGTAVAATTFFRVKAPKLDVKDAAPSIEDGLSGIAAKEHSYVPGVRHTEFDFNDLLVYPDDSLVPVMGILGTDTVTGAGPYTHALTLNNSAFPASYTLVRYDALTTMADQSTSAYFEEVTFKQAHGGRFSLNAKGKAFAINFGAVAKPTNVYSTLLPYATWQGAAIFAGSANTKIVDMEMSLKRAVDPIYGLSNAQTPTGFSVGTLEVSGTITVVPTDLTEFNTYLNNTQPALSVVMTQGVNTLTFQMSKLAIMDGSQVEHSANYTKAVLKFKALSNTLDAGVGNAPVKITAVNARTLTY